MISMLRHDTKGVTRIGIYGMGGVGKTTLAKALYNQLLQGSFRGSSFLANVRETSGTTRGLISLQQQLINDILKSKNIVEVPNVDQGTEIIKARMSSIKVLVVIDDLDHHKQYESLVGPFESGSLVIITTRHEELLDTIEVESRYRFMVNVLDDADSLTLFTRHAFGNTKLNYTLMVLFEDILRHAGGLPLALEVFGSYLYKRPEVGWKYFVEKLQQRMTNSTIQQRLVISLDALESEDPMLKKMFLDIACFFIGRVNEDVVKIMETYYSYADNNIDILKKRCLLTINNKDQLGMHDLLRDIGREVSRNNSPDEAGKHSRLWASKDIFNVLKNDKGTEAIEGIIFDLDVVDAFGKLSFAAETFKRMSRLRFLHLSYINLTGSFEETLEDLRWFQWYRCPLKYFPSEVHLQKLVVLLLPESKMIQMCVLKVFDNLKTLNMAYSLNLTTTPDFTKFPCLETLNLEGCQSLAEVHISIGRLVRLVSLNLHGCVSLTSLPDTICNLRALEVLNIGRCYRLKALPKDFANIESLKELDASSLSISTMPDSIGYLSKLVVLKLSYNFDLVTLPNTISNLRSLEILNISACERLEILPDQLWKITRLRELVASTFSLLRKLPDIESSQSVLSLKMLDLSLNILTALPSGFGQLLNLEHLNLSHCHHLLSISELPPKLKQMVAYGCKSLKKLPNLSNLKQLESLDLRNCSDLTEIQGLKELISVRALFMKGCNSLLLEYTLTKRLLQMYSGFGHQTEVYIQPAEFPDWIHQSPNWIGQSSCIRPFLSSTMTLDLPPNVSHNFLGMILCFQNLQINETISTCYSVKNTTSEFIWTGSYFSNSQEVQIIIVPKSIFPIRDGDDRIELSTRGEILWIHLLYETEITMIDDRNSIQVTSYTGYPSKRLK